MNPAIRKHLQTAMVRRWPYVGLLLTVLVSWYIYGPGLQGGFLFDDNVTITENRHLKFEQLSLAALWEASLSSDSGPLGRPLSMLSFALNTYFSGTSSYAFKLTNLAIHMASGIAIFFLALLLADAARTPAARPEPARQRWFALICATLWLLHPFNLTAVLYVTQRMASLAAMFTIFGLCLYVAGRTRYARYGKQLILAGIPVCGALALLAKESGALLPLFALLIELIFFRFAAAGNVRRRFLLVVFSLFILLPGVLLSLFLIFRSDWLMDIYAMRPFSLKERLLTEARVVLFYLQMSLLPDINQMGLQHDDISLSRSWMSPSTTLPAVVLCVMLPILATVVAVRDKSRVITFAILWFFAAHSLESTILPLEIAHEHRNYLALFGPVFAVAHLLTLNSLPYVLPRLALAIAIIMILALQTGERARTWGNFGSHIAHELKNHPLSPRAHKAAANLLVNVYIAKQDEKYLRLARNHFRLAADLAPHELAPLASLLIMEQKSNGEFDPAIFTEIIQRAQAPGVQLTSLLSVRSLLDCINRGDCTIPPQYIAELFRSLLGNRNLAPRLHGVLFTMMADYSFNILEDYGQAIRYSDLALKIEPNNVTYHINRTKLLTVTGQFDAARDALMRIKKLDRYYKFRSVIEAEYARLETYMRKAVRPDAKP